MIEFLSKVEVVRRVELSSHKVFEGNTGTCGKTPFLVLVFPSGKSITMNLGGAWFEVHYEQLNNSLAEWRDAWAEELKKQ